jgi:Ohr subfamily peroxiredoxin
LCIIDIAMDDSSRTPAPLAKTLYVATATAHGGRDGKVATDDGKLDVTVTPPRELGGTGNGTNPEQLFAAGYAACFGSALGLVARTKKITTGPVAITAKVSLGPVGAAYGLQVALIATIPELSPEEALALVRAAHEVCPYSNATRGNVVVDLAVQ